MNLTNEQFVDGAERSIIELPKIIREHKSVDAELWEEYAEQLNWMTEHFPEVEQDIQKKIDEFKVLKKRLQEARSDLLRMRGNHSWEEFFLIAQGAP